MSTDWDTIYRQETLPQWCIGEPQPYLAGLIDTATSDVLDAGCGHGALSLALAARGHTVVGLDISPTAIEAARTAATAAGLTTVMFEQADVTTLSGYDNRFTTIFDSGLFHSLDDDEARQSYLRATLLAAVPGAQLYILAFSLGFDRGGPPGFTEDQLRDAVGQVWSVDDVRPAMIFVNWYGDGPMPTDGLLLNAYKGV